jgi:hypothetical protein
VGDTVVGDDEGWMEGSGVGWGALGAVVLCAICAHCDEGR